MNFEKVFLANDTSAQVALRSAQEFLHDSVESTDRREDVMIVMAEAVNNVVEHAFLGAEIDEIRLSVLVADKKVVVELRDKGGPIPAELFHRREMPDLQVETQDLPEGGFGWPILQSLSEDINYARIQGENRLRLTLPI